MTTTRSRCARRPRSLLRAVVEEDAVRQPGQRVVGGEALGDERLAPGALDREHRQRQERQQHRRRVEREDGERREAEQDALGRRLADELARELVAQAGPRLSAMARATRPVLTTKKTTRRRGWLGRPPR